MLGRFTVFLARISDSVTRREEMMDMVFEADLIEKVTRHRNPPHQTLEEGRSVGDMLGQPIHPKR